MKGKLNPIWGHQHTDEAKNKISKARIGFQYSNKQKEKFAKLTYKEVRVIKRALKWGISQYKIAKRFNIKQPTISDIKTGRSWGYI